MPKNLVRKIDRIAELADRDRTYVINFFLEEQIAQSKSERIDVPNDISRARAQMQEEEAERSRSKKKKADDFISESNKKGDSSQSTAV